jgi:hypothetical protein
MRRTFFVMTKLVPVMKHTRSVMILESQRSRNLPIAIVPVMASANPTYLCQSLAKAPANPDASASAIQVIADL